MGKNARLVNIYIKIHNKHTLTLEDLKYLSKYDPECFEKTCKNIVYKIPETKEILQPIKEEQTTEPLLPIFEKKQPQVSLLFDTDEGYFSYCVIAPHLLEKGIGIPLNAGNAVAEIEKYLMERETGAKPKVLVVDDSLTIRQGIKKLLGGDYDVSGVSSGVSAIRAITLERPDLILLDYEMPVCDGRYVLEMLRSEAEFADIPVIFLTSKDDPESVKKVLELKPDGYLLKYLKPTEIKRRVDEFLRGRKIIV